MPVVKLAAFRTLESGIVFGAAETVRLNWAVRLPDVAVTTTGPAVWPAVTLAVATPFASVVALLGDTLALPLDTAKLTPVLATPVPLALISLT